MLNTKNLYLLSEKWKRIFHPYNSPSRREFHLQSLHTVLWWTKHWRLGTPGPSWIWKYTRNSHQSHKQLPINHTHNYPSITHTTTHQSHKQLPINHTNNYLYARFSSAKYWVVIFVKGRNLWEFDSTKWTPVLNKMY